ncbi:MAG: hypothetical protein GY757_48465 [bacterium]|nr:hypothetical protein [bacterium]
MKNFTHRFLSVTVSGYAATAVIEISGKDGKEKPLWTKHLSLYKFKTGWKIVNLLVYMHHFMPPEAHTAVTLDPGVYDAYAGTYELKSQLKVLFSREKDSFFVRLPFDEPIEIYPKSETEFFSGMVPGVFAFFKNKEGEVTKMVMSLGTHKEAGRKLEQEPEVDLSMEAGKFDCKEVVAGPFGSREEALKKYGGRLPGKHILLEAGSQDISFIKGFFLLKEESIVSTGDLVEVGRTRDNFGSPAIDITFSPDAAARMKAYSSKNIGKRLAIIINHRVLSTPTLNGVIAAKARIMGKFTKKTIAPLIMSLKVSVLKNKKAGNK